MLGTAGRETRRKDLLISFLGVVSDFLVVPNDIKGKSVKHIFVKEVMLLQEGPGDS